MKSVALAGIWIVAAAAATGSATTAVGFDCQVAKKGAALNTKASTKVDQATYTCELNSFQPDYVQAIERSKAWIVKNGPAAGLRSIRVRRNHWDRPHVQAALSPTLTTLSILDNGVAIHVEDLLKAPNLEELVLDGSDLVGVKKLSELRKVTALGFAITSNDPYDFRAVLSSMKKLRRVDVYGNLLSESEAAYLAPQFAGTSVQTIRFLFRPRDLKPSRRAKLQAKANALKALLPKIAIELSEHAADEDAPGAFHED